jgi:hypothetical protein
MPLICLLFLLLFVKKISKQEIILFIYLTVNILLFAATNVMAHYSINNLFLYHFYYWFELVIISLYICRFLLKNSMKTFYILSIVYTALWILDMKFWEPLDIFNSYAAGLENIILLLLCMFYMLQLSRSEEIMYFQKLPGFWFASAFLVSCALSILGVLAYNYYLLNSPDVTGLELWFIPSVATIIKFVLISAGFLCYRRQPLSQSLSL